MVKKIILIVITGIFLILAFIIFANIYLEESTDDQVYYDLNTIPSNQVGLVLGTSPWLSDGRENLFFNFRIKAALDLWKKDKVKHLLVSGDNSTHQYNEPQAMKEALVAKGVPPEAITLDYAGFRTLDSVVRCFKVFGQKKFTIISQPFHNHRALFIANYYDLDAIAYNARNVYTQTKKTQFREYLAKVKAILDLYILKKEPKFLGKKEPILLHE